MRIVPLLMILLLAGCNEQDVRLLEQKADAPLRQRLEQLQGNREDEPIAVFGKCTKPIDDGMQKKLGKTGMDIRGVTGDLFLARGPSTKVINLAQLDFVSQLSLSQISSPLGQ